MKLSGANFIELSLSLGFAVIVLSTSLGLIQESSNRINKSYQFQQDILESIKPISQMNQYGQWVWNSNIELNSIFPNIPTNTTITIDKFEFSNNAWIPTTSSGISSKITFNYSNNQHISFYLADYASKHNLSGKLMLLRKALNKYKSNIGNYPPSHHLNNLVDANILSKLPNNPYTENDETTFTAQNITDWNYINNNNNVTISPYSHPNISISFSN